MKFFGAFRPNRFVLGLVLLICPKYNQFLSWQLQFALQKIPTLRFFGYLSLRRFTPRIPIVAWLVELLRFCLFCSDFWRKVTEYLCTGWFFHQTNFVFFN